MTLNKGHNLSRLQVLLLLVLHPNRSRHFADAGRVAVTDCRVESDDGEKANRLTCSYPWELNQTQLSFSVVRYENGLEENVLSCNWRDGEPICAAVPGFGKPEMVTNVFTITIPPNQTEDFCCDIYPPEETNIVKRCKSNPTSQRTDHAKKKTNGTLTDHQDPNLDTGGEADQCSHSLIYLSVALNVVLITLAALISYRFYTWWNQSREKRRKMSHAENERMMSNSTMLEKPNAEDTTNQTDLEGCYNPHEKVSFNPGIHRDGGLSAVS